MNQLKTKQINRKIREKYSVSTEQLIKEGKLSPTFHLDYEPRRIGGLSVPKEPSDWWDRI